MISVVASTIALYSTSMLDLDTIFCFLAHHDIKFGPKNIANPPVDFRSSMHPAQSASEKALTIIDGERRIIKAEFMVYFRNQRIRFTAVQ
jgi:hypothetical protein